MPEIPGQPTRTPADIYTQYAKEAIELAERTKSVPLREELLKLATKWLTLADEGAS